MLDVSVVIPVYNEEENLQALYDQLKPVLRSLGLRWEILFIDDGSLDGSLAILRALAERDGGVRVLEFARNFGQTAAIAAGFENAKGRVILPLDADLQNDPADIPLVLEKLSQGYDVVSCWRRDRKDPYFSRVLPSRVANLLISRISGVKLHDYGCTLKGYRRDVLQHVRLYGEMHRFIPIFASWAGARVAEIPVQHRPRLHGESKYGIQRTFKVILDLITVKFLGSFSTKPMYLFGGLGFLSFLGGSVLSLWVLYQKYFEDVKAHRNPVLLIAIFLFIVGVQTILFGLLAELITRTYHEAQGKPTNILRQGDSAGRASASAGEGRTSETASSSKVPGDKIERLSRPGTGRVATLKKEAL